MTYELAEKLHTSVVIVNRTRNRRDWKVRAGRYVGDLQIAEMRRIKTGMLDMRTGSFAKSHNEIGRERHFTTWHWRSLFT